MGGGPLKSKAEVEEYQRYVDGQVSRLCLNKGHHPIPCSYCANKGAIAMAAYEGCIPKDFWDIKASSIRYNREVFDEVVMKYVKSMATALQNGFGLFFFGDNGVGKSYFINYVLMEAVRRGKSVYYTSLPQLDYDIKRGFNDHKHAMRLEYMFTSDFVAIDEIGKVRTKNNSDFMTIQLERILKKRFDDSMPTLLASNMDADGIEKEYGTTISSVVYGKYEQVYMSPGDYRLELAKDMQDKMGYDK